MPNLAHSLHDRDLGFLKILAEHWGIDLHAPDARTAEMELSSQILEVERVREVVDALPGPAAAALAGLQRSQGRLPWPDFTRRFGALREMGPARVDRERPDLEPVSPAEMLWYRALLARGFFDTPRGPREGAYSPDDLLELFPPSQAGGAALAGRPAAPAETAHPVRAGDGVLDQACTLLAALRMKLVLPQGEALPGVVIPRAALLGFLSAAGLIDGRASPRPEAARDFLEAPRGEALAQLARAWQPSPEFNELRLLPGLRCEGEWKNDPQHARKFILDQLAELPAEEWWSLSSFASAIRETHPDFERPAGDFDSWFIRSEAGGEYLRGFAAWDEVDGALIRYLITGPMHWLGILDLAARAPGSEITAFRRSRWAEDLLEGRAPSGLAAENGVLQVGRGGKVTTPRLFPRAARYQLARSAAWEGEDKHGFQYRLTPATLERAREQGLRIPSLVHLLRKHASSPPPPALNQLVKTLENWEANGTQARLEPLLVLRLSSPEILAALRRSPAARFLGEPLGPAAVIVAPGARERILAALIDLGYLAEASFTDGLPV